MNKCANGVSRYLCVLVFSVVEKVFNSTCGGFNSVFQFAVTISGVVVLAMIDEKTTNIVGLNAESSIFGGYLTYIITFWCLKQILTYLLGLGIWVVGSGSDRVLSGPDLSGLRV